MKKVECDYHRNQGKSVFKVVNSVKCSRREDSAAKVATKLTGFGESSSHPAGVTLVEKWAPHRSW